MQRDTMVHSMNLLTFCNNSKYFFDYTNTLVIILLTTVLATHGGRHDNWFLRHKCTSHNIVWHPKKKRQHRYSHEDNQLCTISLQITDTLINKSWGCYRLEGKILKQHYSWSVHVIYKCVGNIKAIKQLRTNYRGLNLTKMVRVVFVTMRKIPFTQI